VGGTIARSRRSLSSSSRRRDPHPRHRRGRGGASVLTAGQAWAGATPWMLPERPDGYSGCDIVLVGSPDLGSWTPPQRRALLDWVRSGGTVIFHGAIDPRILKAAPSGRRSSPRPDRRGARRRASASRSILSGRPRAVDAGDGPRGCRCSSSGRSGRGQWATSPWIPRARHGGGTRRGDEVLGPLRGGGPLRPRRLPALVRNPPHYFPPGGRSLLFVGLYFGAYGVLLGPVLFFVARDRRRRWIAWWAAPAASVLFVLGAPLFFSALSDPSRARGSP